MPARVQNPEIASSDVAWRQIEELIERATTASKNIAEPIEFYGELLDGAIDSLAALGGAVWLVDETRDLRLTAHRDYPPECADSSFDLLNRQIVGEIAASGESRAIAPGTANGSFVHRSACLLLLCPVRVDARSVAVLEVLQPADMPAAARASALDVLESLAEAAADFHLACELRALRVQQEDRDRLDAFAAAVQRSLDVPATAFTIANDGRALIGCDRVWVLSVRGAACRAIAVSGCDHIDRGSESVTAMERLAAAVVVAAEPVWCIDQADELAPAVESRLQEYLDKSQARQLALVPLAMNPISDEKSVASDPIAVIAAESFTATQAKDQFRRRLSGVCLRSRAALGHALSLDSIPGVSLLRRIGSSQLFAPHRRTSRWPWIAALAVVALAAPWLIPADFSVSARGTLQPKLHRNLFAPRDAIVDNVFVAQGDAVVEGSAIIQLRDSDLDYEHVRLVGEIQSTQEQLRHVQAERVRGDVTSATNVPNGSRLAADQEMLEKRLVGLQRQQQLLQAQQAALRLCSPISGQVLTWDIANQWRHRPVRQGERLAEIADVAGEWILELDVADRDVRHVLALREELDVAPEVRFLLATDLQTTYEGRVDRIASTAEHREGESPSVRVTVRVLDANPTSLKAGASVVARIECGRRSLGYVWLHDAIDAMRQYMWW